MSTARDCFLIFVPLVLAWSWMHSYMRKVLAYREKHRKMVLTIKAVDRASEAFRRMGMQVEVTYHSMRRMNEAMQREDG